MTVGHLRGGGGNLPQAKTVPGGLLGADYEIANGRYRIKRILDGRELEPAAAGTARRTRAEHQSRRLSALHQGPRTGGEGRYFAAAGKYGRQEYPDPRRAGPVRRELARDDRGPGGQRSPATQPGVDRSQSPQGGRTERRQARVRLSAGYRTGRTHRIHPLLFRADGKAGRGDRRALQRRRPGGGLHHQRVEPAAAGLVEPALRRDLSHAGGRRSSVRR